MDHIQYVEGPMHGRLIYDSYLNKLDRYILWDWNTLEAFFLLFFNMTMKTCPVGNKA